MRNERRSPLAADAVVIAAVAAAIEWIKFNH